MSNRFYVNDVQIFGKNEMFDCTYEEIKRQGGDWDDDNGLLPKMEITDPQGLMDAVTEDSLLCLKECLTDSKTFEKLNDTDILLSDFDDKELLKRLYNDDGTINKNNFFGLPIYIRLQNWIGVKRCFTPFMLWIAIKDCVDMDYNTMKLSLKEGQKIIAEMY